MRHLFLVNPRAGRGGSTGALLERIAAAFPDGGAQVIQTGGPGEARDAARQAAETGEPVRIYACGGDGTLNEVVNGAAGFDNAAVTNVPKGTGNDFLRIFGKSANARFSDLAALREGPQRALDLMDCNGLLGIGVACAGVDARIAADVHQYTALPFIRGTGAYVMSLIVNVLFKGIDRPMEVEMGPVRFQGPVSILCVCNGRYYGGGFMPVAEAQPDDGVLDMLLVPKVSRRTFFRLVGAYAQGRYRDYPQLIQAYHGRRVTFSSPQELVAVVDGEVLRSRQFTIALSEKKINFFYPEGIFWRKSLQSANNS